MNKIFITGDMHGEMGINKFSSGNWSIGKTLEKSDYVIILGDFGLIWNKSYSALKTQEYYLNWLDRKPWTTLFIDGNHENFDRLLSNEFQEIHLYDLQEKEIGKVKQISDSVFYLQRGHIYTINNKTFFCMGGATSIDKENRTIGDSWWDQELPSFRDFKLGLDNLAIYGKKSNYIYSHTCFNLTFLKLNENQSFYYKENQEKNLRNYFDIIEKEIKFDKWFFGHFRIDKDIDKKHTVLYDNIVELL